MKRRKKGTLKSGKGGKGGTVKSRKQAIAIGLPQERQESPSEKEVVSRACHLKSLPSTAPSATSQKRRSLPAMRRRLPPAIPT
jgi:hypothetical protein